MAAVKGILVNDGGAPARIINFTAAAAISAGECCKIDTNGKAALATDGTLPVAGFALADAASGDLVSLVTGSGVVIYAITTAVTVGDTLMADTSGTAGSLDTTTADTDEFVAIALETNATVDSLTKVLVK
tara:strand:- start:949 stop:1338 length:390 start_codon:yes stop_codon:yes gene_type:complete